MPFQFGQKSEAKHHMHNQHQSRFALQSFKIFPSLCVGFILKGFPLQSGLSINPHFQNLFINAHKKAIS